MESKYIRTIKSFVKREGRLTAGQQRALDVLWPESGIDYSTDTLDINKLFDRPAPVVLEIGFGNGDSLFQMAQNHPDRNYIGIEVHRPGVGHLLQLIETHNIKNLKVICHDAVDVIENQIPDNSLDRVQVIFS